MPLSPTSLSSTLSSPSSIKRDARLYFPQHHVASNEAHRDLEDYYSYQAETPDKTPHPVMSHLLLVVFVLLVLLSIAVFLVQQYYSFRAAVLCNEDAKDLTQSFELPANDSGGFETAEPSMARIVRTNWAAKQQHKVSSSGDPASPVQQDQQQSAGYVNMHGDANMTSV